MKTGNIEGYCLGFNKGERIPINKTKSPLKIFRVKT